MFHSLLVRYSVMAPFYHYILMNLKCAVYMHRWEKIYAYISKITFCF